MKYVLFTVALFLLIIYFVPLAINKIEHAECIALKEQSTQHADFFLASWQQEMCEHYGVVINVK